MSLQARANRTRRAGRQAPANLLCDLRDGKFYVGAPAMPRVAAN